MQHSTRAPAPSGRCPGLLPCPGMGTGGHRLPEPVGTRAPVAGEAQGAAEPAVAVSPCSPLHPSPPKGFQPLLQRGTAAAGSQSPQATGNL